jgi:hypothetical protein
MHKLTSKFIHLKTAKFPILPGEDEELVNDGTYGKALALYLQTKLQALGYEPSLVCCEDWGWWITLSGFPFTFGVCIYSLPADDNPTQFVCSDGATGSTAWSWKSWRFLDTTPAVDKLHADLLATFRADNEIEIVGVTEEFPF